MKCHRCQHDNTPTAKFCESCGAPLSRSCANCGTTLSASANFCPECGQPAGVSSAVADRFRSPQAYTPEHLAEKILTSRSALEGERKQVTVLFCDLADSTALAERLGPEAMHALLNRFFELALGEVHRYEGTVNQFLGDGFMALFGAPVAHEDHARRAVLAAVGLQRALHERRAELGQELSVRMGLHTGPVVVGTIGDDLRMDYTAMGDTTHLAARLQHLTEPGAIYVSAMTQALVDAYADITFVGERPVKGLAPQRVYRVDGLKAGATRFDAVLRRGLSPLVGRRQELAVLEEAHREAQAGSLRVVDLVGEAGIGKSRLLYEFRQRLAGEPVFVLEGHCASFGRATPFLPFIAYDECWEEAIEGADEALRILSGPIDRLTALTAKGVALVLMGRAAEGLDFLREARQAAIAGGWPAQSLGIDAAYGVGMVLAGQMAAGVRWLEDAIRRFAGWGNDFGPTWGHLILGEVYLGLVLGEKRPPFRIVLKNLPFLLQTVPVAARKARGHLEEGVRRAREIGMPALLARGLLGLGLLSKVRRRPNEARPYLEEAYRAAEPHSARLTEGIRQALESLEPVTPGA